MLDALQKLCSSMEKSRVDTIISSFLHRFIQSHQIGKYRLAQILRSAALVWLLEHCIYFVFVSMKLLLWKWEMMKNGRWECWLRSNDFKCQFFLSLFLRKPMDFPFERSFALCLLANWILFIKTRWRMKTSHCLRRYSAMLESKKIQ